MAQRITNAEFAKNNKEFQKACAKVGLDFSSRQASKWRNRKGKAWKSRKGESNGKVQS